MEGPSLDVSLDLDISMVVLALNGSLVSRGRQWMSPQVPTSQTHSTRPHFDNSFVILLYFENFLWASKSPEKDSLHWLGSVRCKQSSSRAVILWEGSHDFLITNTALVASVPTQICDQMWSWNPHVLRMGRDLVAWILLASGTREEGGKWKSIESPSVSNTALGAFHNNNSSHWLLSNSWC